MACLMGNDLFKKMNSFYSLLVLVSCITTVQVHINTMTHEISKSSDRTDSKTESILEEKNSASFGSYKTSKKKRGVSKNNCEKEWRSFGKSCYKVDGVEEEEWVSWDKAEEFCVKEGGHLASIHSADTNRFLLNLVESSALMHVWIGLHDRQNETQYEWTDGTTLGFKYWAKHEPSRKFKGIEEDCEEMYYFSRYEDKGKWNDVNCGRRRPFICQKTEVNHCLPATNNSCNNRGVCEKREDKMGYVCKCNELFSGKTCEHVNHCLPTMNNSCSNRGVCKEKKHKNGYKCRCKGPFSGKICEHDGTNTNNQIAGAVGGAIGSVLVVTIIAATFKFRSWKKKKGKESDYLGLQEDK